MDEASGALAGGEAGPAASPAPPPLTVEQAWRLILALRRRVDDRDPAGEQGAPWGFRSVGREWMPAPVRAAELVLDPATGAVHPRRRALAPGAQALLDLHLDDSLRPRGQVPHVVAVLGQSLDGFIATRSGHSRYINGSESLAHLHRLRALSDAVVIGVGTALADEPRLTTRHVPGPDAVRVVIDPRGRLPASSGLLRDGAAATLVVRAATDGSAAAFEARLTDQATALHLPARDRTIAPRLVLAALAARGLSRLLIEGGGVTVGRFLEAGLIDRLQLAVSPIIIGSGRPALPLDPIDRLEEALRPASRRHILGEDVLFELRFGRPAAQPCCGA
jgi:diaminohydroxyphosphoribosylaminopyrimidine deaminase / 5-amino-6-(5-phosphoribosylamino)uracil reductase